MNLALYLFAHAPQKNVSNRWYTPALLCVYVNRKMAVVLRNFWAMFPFETCVKESDNQPNGFVESRIKSQQGPFQKVKA